MVEGLPSPWTFTVAVLAVWRLTHLLHLEHGPWGVFTRLRAVVARLGIGEAFDCFFCLSLWVSLPGAWLWGGPWTSRLFVWLALSAGAILIETRLLRGPHV
ncbi:MAG: hypothetical protein R3E10_06740 [Gemmatimonadota bacterium]